MKVVPLAIPGLFEIIPTMFADHRGTFFESYSANKLAEHGIEVRFVQDNQSFSHKGVLRGLHMQLEPNAQSKLVRVLVGRVLDVALDVRQGSPTFGQHIMLELNTEKNNMLFIPEGFAHGFYALEDTILVYKCSRHYSKNDEAGVLWNDPALQIAWPNGSPILSEKDKELPALADFTAMFASRVTPFSK